MYWTLRDMVLRKSLLIYVYMSMEDHSQMRKFGLSLESSYVLCVSEEHSCYRVYHSSVQALNSVTEYTHNLNLLVNDCS